MVITSRLPKSAALQKLDNQVLTPAQDLQSQSSARTLPLANNALTRQPQVSKVRQPLPKQVFRKVKLPNRETGQHRARHDPLSDELYVTAHRRGERKEKQSRNWDKERAMHEKGELERLLEELQGPDWLKLMGIVGVTDAEAKTFKSKRNIFIARAQTMLDRYSAWNKRDRELKLERERRLAESEEETSSDDDQDSEGSSEATEEGRHQMRRSHTTARARDREKPQQPVAGQRPFNSFFEKPHMREAAMKSYRRGRHVLAFGHPIPEVPELSDFELPKDFVGFHSTAADT